MLKKKHHAESEEDDFRARAKKGTRDKQEKGRFKFAVGENTIRILKTPGDKSRNSPWVFIYWKLHRHVGPKDGWGRCGKDADGNGECWLEDVQIPLLIKKGKREKAAKLAADDVFSVQLAALDQTTGDWRGPLRFDAGIGGPKSMNYRLEQLIQSTKRDCVDPKKGYNVTIERTGTGMTDTTYGPTIFDEEPTAVPAGIMKRLKPFEDILPQYDEDRLKAAYFGREVEEEEPEEEEPKPKKKKLGKTRDEEEEPEEEESEEESSEEESEEEESEEEPEEEEEEEEPAPKKKVKPAKKKPAEEEEEEEAEEEAEEESSEEEEEEPEEEEEEEPAPKKKKPVGKKKPPVEEEEEEEEEEEAEETEEYEEEEPESEEEEEEEEEPAPKKGKKPLKKKPPVEEEEEEEVEEEEEEEEEPQPKKKPLKKKH